MSLVRARCSNIWREAKSIKFIKSGPRVRLSLIFCVPVLGIQAPRLSRGRAPVQCVKYEPQYGFLLGRMTDRGATVIQIWVFGRYVLKKERNDPVTSKSIQSTRQTNGS